MKKKDLWVILAILAVIAIVFGLSKCLPQKHPNAQLVTDQTDSGFSIQMNPVSSTIWRSRFLESFRASAEEAPAEEAQPEEGEKTTKPISEYSDEEILATLGQAPADLYLMVWNGDLFQPVPILPEYVGQTFTLKMGEDMLNEIRFLENGFIMESANCDDQICVSEGEVTLENRDDRILGNMIVCLPHNLVLELRTQAEVVELLRDVLQSYMQ